MKKLILALVAGTALFAAAPSADAHGGGGFHRGPVVVVHPGGGLHPGHPGWGHRPGWGHGGWNHGWDRHHYWGAPWFWVSPGFVWGAPTMIALGGGSAGLQIGGNATDFVLLLMSPRSAKSILKSKVKLGGAAPVGH